MDYLLQLKDSTRSHHDSIEANLNLLREDLSLQDYVQLLERFYGFYVPLEEQLRSRQINWYSKDRFKVGCLTRDLDYFRRNLGAIPLCGTFLVSSFSEDELMGALYVIEGSTLGSQVLSSHFVRKFDLDPEAGLCFFTGYGRETGKKWKEFQQSLYESLCTTELKRQVIIRSAQNTFTALEQWLVQDAS